jgi:hypothetical protein
MRREKQMIRSTFFALVTLLAAASAQAAVVISTTSQPTVDMAGFTTYTLTATSDTAPIAGFDFFGTQAAPLGFRGAMGQVSQPPTLIQTVFGDFNEFFPLLGRNVSQDSQFKFNATGGNAVLVPTGFALEGPDFLKASFALPAPVQSVAFAQIVISDILSSGVNYSGLIGFPTESGLPLVRVDGCVGCGEGGAVVDDIGPTTPGVDATVDTFGEIINLMPVDKFGGLPVTWSELSGPTYQPGFGALPNAPGIGTATWSWNPTTQAFQFKSRGAHRGTYVWTGMAIDPFGADSYSITVEVLNGLIPEPTSLVLFGLAVSALGLVRVQRSNGNGFFL